MASASGGGPQAASGPLFQGVDKQSFAYKLLNKMGWSEGQGLGASKQGITEHVKVKKKFDALGVGAAEAAHNQRDWTTGMISFDAVLAGLQEVRAGGGKRSAGGSSSSSSDSSDSDSSSSDSDSDSSSSSDSGNESDDEAEAKPAAPAVGGRVRAATHVGRYTRREAAKAVRSYSAGDLAAILGGVTGAGAGVTGGSSGGGEATGRDGSSSSSSSGSSDSGSESEGGSEGGDEGTAAAAAAARNMQAPPTPPKSGEAADAPPPAAAWWGAMFVRAGRSGAGGKGPARGGKKARGFSEQDQTDLYNLTHDGATQGRQGLGRASAPRKVAGARWQGTKTRLGDDSASGSGDEDGEEDGEGEAPSGGANALEAAGIVIVPPRRGGGDGGEGAAPPKPSVPKPAAAAEEAPEPKKSKKRGKSRGPQASEEQQQQQEQQRQEQQQQQQKSDSKGKKKDKAGGKSGSKRKRDKEAAAPAAADKAGSKKARKAAAKAAAAAEPAPAPAPAAEPEAAATAPSKVKWARVAEALLAGAPKRRMRVAKLHQRALRAAGLGRLPESEADAAMRRMLKRLSRAAGKFAVCDKYVRLA